MKRVLIISYSYPPTSSPGALRVGKFAKYLPEFGWEPVVVSPRGNYSRYQGETDDTGARVVRTPFPFGGMERAAAATMQTSGGGGVRARVVRAAKSLIYPDRVAPWYPFGMAACTRLVRGERFDALFSSGPSQVNHMIAMRLARRFGIPWVADFRDLWTLAPIYEAGPVRARLDRRLEGRILRRADRVTTVSDHLARTFAAGFPAAAHKLFVVRNGYDPADLPPPRPVPEGPFVLTYAGSFYGGKRDPRGLFAALAALRAEGTITPRTFRMDCIGYPEPGVEAMAARAGVGDLVRTVGRLPYLETMERLSDSSALCVITFTDEGSQGEMTTKLFEYIGTGRPILALAIPGELAGVVRDSGVGTALEHGDVAGIAAWLRERVRAGAAAAAPPPPEVLYPFTRRALAQALAGHLEAAAA